MLLPAYINVNQTGIPALRSLSVTVGTTDVRFDFNNHRNVGRPFRGLLIINLAQLIPTGTTATLPVVFATNGNSQAAVNYDTGEPLTAADVARAGIYDAIYDSEDGVLYVHPTTAPATAAAGASN